MPIVRDNLATRLCKARGLDPSKVTEMQILFEPNCVDTVYVSMHTDDEIEPILKKYFLTEIGEDHGNNC